MIDLSSPNFILSLIMLTINHIFAFNYFGEVRFYENTEPVNDVIIFRFITNFTMCWVISQYAFGLCPSHFSFHSRRVRTRCPRNLAPNQKMPYRIIWIAERNNAQDYSKCLNLPGRRFCLLGPNDTRQKTLNLQQQCIRSTLVTMLIIT